LVIAIHEEIIDRKSDKNDNKKVDGQLSEEFWDEYFGKRKSD